jgi:hypothetical protein
MERDLFKEACDTLFADVETRIGRPMTESEKEGVRSSNSFMFFEVISDSFYLAKTDEQVQMWLKEMDTFRR